MTARFFITRLSAALAAMILPSVAFGGMDQAWFESALVGIETGPTGAQYGYSDTNDTRYCARFDGREIVRQAAAAHSEYLVVWVRDGDYAYYDSKLLPKAPGLAGRDPLREAIEEARRHKLPLIAYCVVQQGGHFLQAHPEWEMRGLDGKPIGRFCCNSGYLEAMKRIVAEQLAYGIDGFHLDMMDQGFGPPYGCWCDTCRALFEQEFGQPMPKGITWDDAWDRMLEFRYRSSERFERALYAHIKSINPRTTVDYNYHGNPPFSFEVGQRPVQHAGNGDFITGETGVWGFSALTVGLNAQFYRAAVPRQRVQVAMQRGVRMYHDQTTRPLNDIRWELLTLLSHGAFVTVVDKTGFDGWLDPVAYERIGAAFQEARARRAHFGHQPVAEVGIYFSSRTRDWMGREQPVKYFQSFQGAHKALVYEHIPWGVVLDENLTLERLGRFPIVLLPNAAILSERELALLRAYAEGGGKLIITGQSGQFDRLGQPLAKSAFSELTGATVKGQLESLDNWVQFPSASIPGSGTLLFADNAEGEVARRKALQEQNARFAPAMLRVGASNWPFLVKGPATIYEAITAASVGELLKPYRTTRQLEGKEGTEWPMSADAPVGPAILINFVGKGTVLTFACSPDYATAGEHHIVEARKLIANAVRFLNPAPPIRINAPTTVEAVVTDDPATRTMRVHLLGYNSPPQTTPTKDRPFVLPGLIEDAPCFKATLNLGRDLKSAKTLNKSTKVERRGRLVNLEVADIHEVVILKY